jgi:MFS family permease
MSQPASPAISPARVTRARDAVMISFLLNGFGFATWVSRIPQARHELGLSNGSLGLLLLVISAGSVLTLPTSGALINRLGAATVVRIGVTADVVGLAIVGIGVGVWASVPVAAAGLFLYGLGVGVWDVAMNVEGAAVEQRLGRTIMPRFHAGFSLGTVVAAGVGAATVAADVPLVWHLVSAAVFMGVLAQATTGWFLPRSDEERREHHDRRSALAAWLEPRTLMIGLMVLALALTEGTANDWLALSLIDGYGVERWVGVAGFALFVTAMTVGRLVGPVVLDRHGRVPVLWATMAAAAVGIVLIVFGGGPFLVVLGILLWGLGASLGFPVGMSAAADDPVHAAARVSVVASIAYTAFLAGPPLLGFLGDQVGTLNALLAVSLILIPSALVVPAAREPTR